MSLKEQVRQKFEEARRTDNREEKNLLSVILGDISTSEARSGQDIPDAEVEKLLRKLVESNTRTIEQMKSHQRDDDPQVAVLKRENELLQALLPKTADAEAITAALDAVRGQIINAQNDGQATGVAMKHLKGTSLNVQGQDVSEAVKQIRANAS